MQGCWFLYGLVVLLVLIYLCNQHIKHRFTPRLDEAHIKAVIEAFRRRPGVVNHGIDAPKIMRDTPVSILVANDGGDWRGKAKELSKQMDPTGNLRISVDIFRLDPERVTIDWHDGLPQTRCFILAWSMALVAVFGFIIVKLSFPFEQAGLILGFLGAIGLFIAEGNYGRPVVYIINVDPTITERVQTMLLRMTSILYIAGGFLLQFYAMVSAKQITS